MTRPCLTERLLMGRRQSSQTNIFSCSAGNYRPVLMQIDYCTHFKLMGILNPGELSLVSYLSLLYPVLNISLRMQVHHFLTLEAPPFFCSRRHFNDISYLISFLKIGKKSQNLSRDIRLPTVWYVQPQSLRSACAYAQSDQILC